MTTQKAKKIPHEHWQAHKQTLEHLWSEEKRKLVGPGSVQEMMEKNYGFFATKSQYEAQFKNWRWSKTQKNDDWERLAAVIRLRQRQKKNSVVFIHGICQPQGRVQKRIAPHARPITQQLSSVIDLCLPEHIIVRTPTLDRTEGWTSGLPFNAIEELLRIEITRSDPRVSTSPNSLGGLESTDSSLTTRSGLYTLTKCHENFVEAAEVQEQDKSVDTVDTTDMIDTTSMLGSPENIDFFILKSVLPPSMTEQQPPVPMVNRAKPRELERPYYRQLLFSMANNFAGLENADMEKIVHFLQNKTTRRLTQLLRSDSSPSSRAIAQSLFKAAIEVGDANLIGLVLSEESLDVDVNRVSIYTEGFRYTPIERASYLQNKEVIKILLNHNADVNRTDPGRHRYNGALEHVVYSIDISQRKYTDHGYHQYNAPRHVGYSTSNSQGEHTGVKPQIFRMLLSKKGDMSDDALEFLITKQDGENAGLFMSANAHKNVAQWSSRGIFFGAVSCLDDHTALAVIRLMIRIGADLNFDTMRLEFLRPHFSWVGDLRRVVDAVARRGNMEMMETLLRSGAMMTDMTLDLAVASGNYDLVWLLLQNGALSTNETLHLAFKSKNYDLVRLLLEREALMTDEALPLAVESENYNLVLLLLEKGALMTGKALQRALASGNYNLVLLLLEKGALMTDEALPLAVASGNYNLVLLLLEKGALMTGKALQRAVASGNYELMQLLLDRGADVNSSFDYYLNRAATPFAEAIRLQDAEAISLLERYGPVRLDNPTQFSAAIRAASQVGNLTFIERLIQLGGQARAEDLGIALAIAIKKGQYETATRLLDAGADVSTYANEIGTPLSAAITQRNAGLVHLLLEAGALPKNIAGEMTSELLDAVKWGDCSIVKALIFAGASVNRAAYSGSVSPLEYAMKRKNHALVDLLLEAGAKIDSDNINSECALDVALRIGDISMACTLLEWGADPTDTKELGKAMVESPQFVDLFLEKHRLKYPVNRAKFGGNALIQAIQLGDKNTLRKMLDRRLDACSLLVGLEERLLTPKKFGSWSPFGYAIDNSTVEVIELFLQTGCNPNSIVFGINHCQYLPSSGYQKQASYRSTGFLAAIETRSVSKVKLLYKYAADVNFPAHTSVKHTPLQKAAAVGSTEIVEFLFRLGADVNAPAARGEGGTALQLAAIGGYIPVACQLLNYQADVNAPASKVNGRMALEGAAEHGRLDMVQLLLNAGAGNQGKDLAQFERAKALANDQGFTYIADLLDDYLQRRKQADEPAMLAVADRVDEDFGMCYPNREVEDTDIDPTVWQPAMPTAGVDDDLSMWYPYQGMEDIDIDATAWQPAMHIDDIDYDFSMLNPDQLTEDNDINPAEWSTPIDF